MDKARIQSRRSFLGTTSALSGGLILACHSSLGRAAGIAEEEEVPATEDLMREHGVLDRVLLIYEEAVRRLEGKKELDPEVLKSAAEVVRQFIEDYHERDEEDYLFPRFEKAGKLTDLVKMLRQQHRAGRQVTESIERLSTLAAFKDQDDRQRLVVSIHAFIRMYRPHAAREDTVLFPAFREIVSPHEYDAIGEEMEKKERQLFGGDGFEKAVAKVAGLEKSLGIHDLAQFTPDAGGIGRGHPGGY
jgi:hemerythrin-like domain-containing protein